jgi:hypothetical protein
LSLFAIVTFEFEFEIALAFIFAVAVAGAVVFVSVVLGFTSVIDGIILIFDVVLILKVCLVGLRLTIVVVVVASRTICAARLFCNDCGLNCEMGCLGCGCVSRAVGDSTTKGKLLTINGAALSSFSSLA